VLAVAAQERVQRHLPGMQARQQRRRRKRPRKRRRKKRKTSDLTYLAKLRLLVTTPPFFRLLANQL
jgi:hypothetical protein